MLGNHKFWLLISKPSCRLLEKLCSEFPEREVRLWQSAANLSVRVLLQNELAQFVEHMLSYICEMW